MELSEKELSQKLLTFHQKNYRELDTHQSISDPKASYFQYSRYYAILEEIRPLDFNSFLDVGCAEGMYLLGVKKFSNNCNLYGVDFSSIALKKARFFAQKCKPILTVADVTQSPFKDEAFDVVLCSETLEHVVDDKMAIKELSRICKKACIITVPSFNNRRAKLTFKPDLDCTFDSHLRKYLRSDIINLLKPYFSTVKVFNLSEWYLSTFDIILRTYVPKSISANAAHFLSNFAALDYKLCKVGTHGHSFLCICSKKSM